MFPENDDRYEEHTLTEVRDEGDTFTIMVDSMCFGIPKAAGVVPKAGDRVRYYGNGIGSVVRGCFINGQKVFYRTEAEQDELHKQQVAEAKRERKAAFEKARPEMDAKFTALPEVFQRRIQRFRDGNPDFRWEYEGYELFTCEQAVVFADALKTVEALDAFRKMKWDDQLKAVPGMQDGHSGNTFGCAVRLAYHYLTTPENVVLEHGAMVPLVGCRDYGCTHESGQ